MNMNRLVLGISLALASLHGAAAAAAEAPAAAPASSRQDAKGSSDAATLDTVVVTGAARTQRRFDASYAVNSLTREDVQKLAPKSYADLLGSVPGIHVEATGGEVQNITRLRGIPTDRGFIAFQQDGLPLYHELDGNFFNSGDGMNRIDVMNQRVEVVRGGPAPIYASSGGAIVNNILAEGSEQTQGKAQVTVGDTGLYRGEMYQSGALGKDTFYAVGGFLREHDGYRDNGFPNDKGGQIRGNIKHYFDDTSWFKVSGTFVDDHNTFYLPIPVADPRNPNVSLDPYINYFTGTLNSPALRSVNLKYLDGAGALQSMNRDLADGRHMRFGNVGFQYENSASDWTISFKSGYTKGRNTFDALYSTTNPVDGTTFANSYLNAARAAFGPGVARMGYALAGSNGASVYNPNTDSGLVMSAQYRAADSDFYSGQADLSATRLFETGMGTHDLNVGVYTAFFGSTALNVYQDMLLQVRGKPDLLDLVAYDANGNPLGYVTDKGTLRYTTTLNRGEVDARMFAVYANDTWTITDRLKIDAGIRHERYHYQGYAEQTAQANLGDPTTLADNTTRRFTGVVQNHELSPKATNWTIGANYDLTSAIGAYARASHMEVVPNSSVARSIDPTIVTTKLDQYELGLKAAYGRSYLYLTAFYTKFDPLNASFVAFNPVTGRNDQSVPFIGTAVSKGVELDGMFRATDWFSVSGAVTASDPQYKDLQNDSGADPAAVNGKQIVREPKLYGNLRPSVNFTVGDNAFETWLRYDFVGKSYVDLFNQTALPAYQTLGLGVSWKRGNWGAQLVGDNLTNEKGLTEGNTRTDALAGQGSAEAIYGRPLFGRNFRLMVSRSW
ncbi:TonB-dependent receptor [Stenotrophomonas sp. 24(2023)]|uniref:TonB-dependent receptor n=1 Tax=Stenotrophomonas sp. 24(2023) TaxID=3068324 RepID=UPI0027E0341C|nr:TonB-dependent receptor [Stenotrophomonas sp. 24(2023)]WMJ71239.1 TonB-dependent receptor [Stenotrophomonas sp. 24(2023)]